MLEESDEEYSNRLKIEEEKELKEMQKRMRRSTNRELKELKQLYKDSFTL